MASNNQDGGDKMEKTIVIRLQDENQKIYRWSISRGPRAVNLGTGLHRVVHGWQFTDHDGYSRFVEGNWID
ncbi:MAG: hypothetical protein KGI27_14620, partial [Thaumarchaeota archaeon]|nr:hypothetical protein [Nitrososphaerota archaeon]